MKILALLIAFVLPPLVRAADAPATAPAKPLRELLQQGLFEEEANRDLGKAAAAYTELLAQFDSQRAFAATALFRLAEIRAKQGDNAAAIALHQRLLAEFPTHDPLAKLSRERLAALGGPAPAPASSEAPTSEEAQELARIRGMAKNSPDLINARGDGGATPLGRAAKAGWLEVASYLLDHGAQVDPAPGYEAPLQIAAEEGHKRMVELLLARGADVQRKRPSGGETALWAACAGNRAEVARVLLEAGADPNVLAMTQAYPSQAMTPLSLAAAAGNESLAKLLLDHRADPNLEGNSPLALAVSYGKKPLAELLLARGAKVDAAEPGGTNPLHVAVEHAPALIDLLLEHGAKIDAADRDGATPLHLAAQMQPDAVPLLLAHGASPNARKTDGLTPLHASVGEYWTHHPQSAPPFAPLIPAEADKLRGVWEALLAKGAEINAQDKAGRTPLHYAMERADFPNESLVWLMEHGADLLMVDNSGISALEMAGAERWTFFARRDLFPKLTQERAVNLFVNDAKATNDPSIKARHIIAPTAESEAPPTLADLIRAVFDRREGKAPSPSLWLEFDAVVYRADAAGALREAARVAMNLGNSKDTSQWSMLHWGDVVVFEHLTESGRATQNSDVVERWLEKLGFPRRETK